MSDPAPLGCPHAAGQGDALATPLPTPTGPVPVDDACAAMIRLAGVVREREEVALGDALGRVLACDLNSPIDVPAHDNAAMDGYACAATSLGTDGPSRLRVVGTAWAGRPWPGRVAAGEALRIMTGAVMPEGADTVVPQEDARRDGDSVLLAGPLTAGTHRRRRGEDLARGGPMLAAGQRLGAAELGLIASVGLPRIPVYRRLRVACLSTGSELRAPGQPLADGEIYDSNRQTLAGMLAPLGVEMLDFGVIPDEPAALEAALREAAASADAVISSGGVSVGEADHTRQLMARLGDVVFWTVAMRPGRPLAFGRLGSGACYFGLPGNPVAVMITFLFLVRPALLSMMGARDREPLPVRARSLEPMRKKPGRTEYQRVIVAPGPDGVLEMRTTGSQGSGILSSMSRANAIARLAHDQGAIAPGDLVECLLFEGLL
jgi:molybdopterin molybdotransferase